MISTMPRTTEYTVQPFAFSAEAIDADAIDKILTSLESDDLVHGPVVGYDDDTHRVDAIFQVLFGGEADASHDAATRIAIHALSVALAAAKIAASTVGSAVVEGGDPDLLP